MYKPINIYATIYSTNFIGYLRYLNISYKLDFMPVEIFCCLLSGCVQKAKLFSLAITTNIKQNKKAKERA